ncbi:DUF3267 domain-containing protein [Clostridium sp. C8-1-8]|uniref:DUF3267 domain-containing protein n=1 Tax=Clostridium sp. C8-1-8 TaxID=2698831 RepID=UPI0013717DC9|nr:DUF3267 domain-containing protein [Clostridium sp. C8-1-8]
MRYIKKMPSTDMELSNRLIAEGWRKLKEPSSMGQTMFFSIPFIFFNGAISLLISYNLYTPLKGFLATEHVNFTFNISPWALLYLAIIGMFMLVHELLHACFIPNFLQSDKTYWGINGFNGFVFTTEKIKKGRFLIISIMPFFLLSIVLPFLLKALGLLNGFTIFLCLINAMGSCADCLNLCLVAVQVPKGAYIVNNGFETYFK